VAVRQGDSDSVLHQAAESDAPHTRHNSLIERRHDLRRRLVRGFGTGLRLDQAGRTVLLNSVDEATYGAAVVSEQGPQLDLSRLPSAEQADDATRTATMSAASHTRRATAPARTASYPPPSTNLRPRPNGTAGSRRRGMIVLCASTPPTACTIS
jgi:hypothetical protein